jgi:hypothetical protein
VRGCPDVACFKSFSQESVDDRGLGQVLMMKNGQTIRRLLWTGSRAGGRRYQRSKKFFMSAPGRRHNKQMHLVLNLGALMKNFRKSATTGRPLARACE